MSCHDSSRSRLTLTAAGGRWERDGHPRERSPASQGPAQGEGGVNTPSATHHRRNAHPPRACPEKATAGRCPARTTAAGEKGGRRAPGGGEASQRARRSWRGLEQGRSGGMSPGGENQTLAQQEAVKGPRSVCKQLPADPLSHTCERHPCDRRRSAPGPRQRDNGTTKARAQTGP